MVLKIEIALEAYDDRDVDLHAIVVDRTGLELLGKVWREIELEQRPKSRELTVPLTATQVAAFEAAPMSLRVVVDIL